jgi:nucleotide-binding universal stress UspA family protein
MIKFKRILFPTDFSPSAQHALDYAISLALEYESSIILGHVIEDISFNSSFTLSSFPTSLEYHHGMEEKAKEELARVLSPQLKRQINVEEAVVRGRPFVEIIRLAKEKSADLIVMATHSQTGIRHSHLGSTAERVVRKAPCPVMVIRHPEYQFIMP